MRNIGDNTIYRIDWQEVTPLVLLPRALRFALSVRIFIWTFLGMALTIGIACFLTTELPQQSVKRLYPRTFVLGIPADFWSQPTGSPDDWAEIPNSTSMIRYNDSKSSSKRLQAPTYPWQLYTISGYKLYKTDVGGWGIFLGNCIWFVLTLLIWACFGAAITRITAVRFARNQREETKLICTFIRQKYLSYIGAVLLPMTAITLCLVPLWIESCLQQSGLTCLAAIWLPVAVVFGFLALLLAIGLILGWPLMFATISTEGSDAFDAIGRAYSYIYQRPIQFFFYHAVNLVICAVVTALFVLMVQMLLTMIQTHGSLNILNRGNGLIVDAFGSKPCGMMITLIVLWLVEMTAVIFPFVYFWVSSTVIYFLLRRSCDATPFDQVYRIGPAAIKRNIGPIIKTEDGTLEVDS